jgi:hypothetical protein
MRILGYVDPGSGLVVIQMAIAAISGFLFSLKRFRERVFGLFRKSSAKPPVEPIREPVLAERPRGAKADHAEVKD